MSEPMTDADLTAIERLLMYGVIGTDPADASGATTDDVAEVAGDLLAEVRRLQDEVAGANENVASWQGIAADLRADRDELEASYYVLLSQCHRLEEERNRLRAERTAMLDALEELADLTGLPYVTQDGPYVDGMLVRDLQEARAALARVRTLIGDDDE